MALHDIPACAHMCSKRACTHILFAVCRCIPDFEASGRQRVDGAARQQQHARPCMDIARIGNDASMHDDVAYHHICWLMDVQVCGSTEWAYINIRYEPCVYCVGHPAMQSNRKRFSTLGRPGLEVPCKAGCANVAGDSWR